MVVCFFRVPFYLIAPAGYPLLGGLPEKREPEARHERRRDFFRLAAFVGAGWSLTKNNNGFVCFWGSLAPAGVGVPRFPWVATSDRRERARMRGGEP